MQAGSAIAFSAANAAPYLKTANQRWQPAYDHALTVLAGNVQVMPRYGKPVLIEGSVYRGIWMECGPLEALVYRKFRPDVARNSHLTFWQIQMVAPMAATAWELVHATRVAQLRNRRETGLTEGFSPTTPGMTTARVERAWPINVPATTPRSVLRFRACHDCVRIFRPPPTVRE